MFILKINSHKFLYGSAGGKKVQESFTVPAMYE